jgi:hypothetical protein
MFLSCCDFISVSLKASSVGAKSKGVRLSKGKRNCPSFDQGPIWIEPITISYSSYSLSRREQRTFDGGPPLHCPRLLSSNLMGRLKNHAWSSVPAQVTNKKPHHYHRTKAWLRIDVSIHWRRPHPQGFYIDFILPSTKVRFNSTG